MPSTCSNRPAPPSPTTNARRKREFAEIDVDIVPASSTARPQQQLQPSPVDNQPRKQRRVGPGPGPEPPRTLPAQPHAELLAELRPGYDLATASVISSSKIRDKVSAVLAHLGHVDLFSPESRPGVMMLHARAGDAGKMVTVMEVAKRRMGDAGTAWYQYNRVYEVAGGEGVGGRNGAGGVGGGGSRTVVEDTIMGAGGEEGGDEDEDDSFEPVQMPLGLSARDKPAAANQSKTTYMSMFLSRVPIPELQSKAYLTLQTNASELGNQRKA